MAAVTLRETLSSTANVATYASDAFIPGAGELLVVAASVAATVDDGAVTDTQGLGFTRVGFTDHASGHRLFLFISNATAAASSMTVTVDVTGDNGTGCNIVVVGVSGMSKTGATAAKQVSPGATGASTAPSDTFGASVLTGNPTIGLEGCTDTAGNAAAVGWTDVAEIGHSTPTFGVHVMSRNSGFTGTTITWGESESNWAAILLELDASASGATLERAAAIAATGVITSAATFFSVFTRTAALAATGALASVPERDLLRSAALAATGAIAADSERDLLRSATIAATAGVASSGEFFSIVERAASLATTAAITSSGEIEAGAETFEHAAALDATAAITSAPQRDLLRAASVGATGAVISTGVGLTVVQGAASVSAAAGIATAPQRDLLRATSVDATGAIVASGQIEGQAQTHEGSASVSATGAVSSAGQRDLIRSSAVSATGAIASDGERTLIRSAIVNATSAVTVAYQRELVRAAALDAIGHVAASGGVSTVLERAAVIAAIASIDTSGARADAWSYGPYPGESYGPYPGFSFGGTTSYTYTAGTAWTYLEI